MHREFFRIGIAEDLQFFDLDFKFLARALAFHQIACNGNRRACCDALKGFLRRIFKIDYALDVVDRRAVIERDELIIAKSADPAFGRDVLQDFGAAEQVFYFGVFHGKCRIIGFCIVGSSNFNSSDDPDV